MDIPARTHDAPILIVDDDDILRALMRASLENEGFSVLEASSGEEACEITASRTLGLIVVDVVMPGMDGYALCRLLRSRPETAFVPILMATGRDDVESVEAAYVAGATDFIAKPLNWPLLNYRVRYILRAARAFDELQHNQDRLIAAKDEAEAASRAKSEFLANMSHELRTPLNAIIGFSQIIKDQSMGPVGVARYAEYAKDIFGAGEHLLALINNVLDISKIQAGKFSLKEEPVDLQEIVQGSLAAVSAQALKNKVTLMVDLPASLPGVRADAVAMRQIVINLLSNAVKFTSEGGEVTVAGERSLDGGLDLSVADTGIGMTEDEIKIALEPFRQVENALTKKYEGTGLGLPIARRLVELHGGRLDIASKTNTGTVIRVHLPRERVLTAKEVAA